MTALPTVPPAHDARARRPTGPRARATCAPTWIGLDLGTSGCRAVAIDAAGERLAEARATLPEPHRPAPGWVEQDPEPWWQAALDCLSRIAQALPRHQPVAICCDATSATLLLTDPDGVPLGPALMYDDRRALAQATRIAAVTPAESPARGPSASLAKLLHLHDQLDVRAPVLALHQADWISGRLRGQPGASDWNNALKLGYDAERRAWPAWVETLVPATVSLPEVHPPGARIGTLAPALAARLGWSRRTRILAGTTDSTAAVIATGATMPGDAVTSLGSTLVLKILADRPITASAHGIYSHRLGERWLVGGASNSGGAVLRRYFSDTEIAMLSQSIDPTHPSGLDYYPLLAPGERFPRNDPGLAPRLDPRPPEPRDFLQGLLEGIARIEAEGYARLAELGAPPPRRIIGIGGGAANPTWCQIRARLLGVPVETATRTEAADGVALLALRHTPIEP